MSNVYDDLPGGLIAAPPSAAIPPNTANAYDDITPPMQLQLAPRAPPSAADRVQAAEGGFLKGAAYLAALPLDVPANAFELGNAALGTAYGLTHTTESQAPLRTPGGLYHYIAPNGSEVFSKNPPPAGAKSVTYQHTEIPSAFNSSAGPSPVGAWLTQQLDKSPITTTQPTRPDDAASRYLSAAGSVVPGAIAGGGGAVGSTTRAIAGALPSAAVGQTVAEARPFQSDTANNTAAVLAQALTGYGVPAGTKAVIRGVSPGTMQANVQSFRDAGAEPSLAQAAATRRMQFLESGLSKIPGGAGVIEGAAKRQAQALRAGVDQTVDQVAPGGVSPERAGRAITQGITGDTGWRDQFNAKADQLYGVVDGHIAPDTPASVANTVTTLDAIAKPNSFAPATTAALVNPKVSAIRQALMSDLGTQGSTLPYSTLSELRSKVGEMLSGSDLTSDIPRAQVKRLYGGLSADLQAAAQQAGPDAAQAFSRANTYYNAGAKRMDVLADVLSRNGGPEQVFNGAMSGTKDGATRLRAVMQSLAPEQQQVVAATVFKRMGQATAGNQNAEGDVFSPETFLTNYNRMSPEAKSALFDRFPDLRDKADNLADVAENLRTGSKVFRNASGTAAAEGQTHLMHMLVGSLLGGAGAEGAHAFGPGGVAMVAGVPVAANLLARGMTSPTAINWAARPALGSASQAASALSVVPNQRDDRQRLVNALQASGIAPGGQ